MSFRFIVERIVHLAHEEKYRTVWQYITQYFAPGKVVEIERKILWFSMTVPMRKKRYTGIL